MNNSLIPIAILISVSVVATGCGLFESNDDEIQTLRAELVQLREDVLDLETEIELLAVAPPQPEPLLVTTTTTTEVEDVQVTTTTAQLPTLPSIIDTVVAVSTTVSVEVSASTPSCGASVVVVVVGTVGTPSVARPLSSRAATCAARVPFPYHPSASIPRTV